MPTKLTIQFAGVGDAMRGGGVRAALRERAQHIAAAAGALEAAERTQGAHHTHPPVVAVQEGTKPKGRPFARVTSTHDEAEFGTSRTARRNTLGRAAQQGR